MNNRLINTKVAGGGGGCTNIVDNYDPFGDGNGYALYQLNGDATDESTNYNGISVNNVTWGGTGVFGTSGSFNGSNSIITLPDNIETPLRNSNEFTITGWFNTTTTSTRQGILSFYQDVYIYIEVNASGVLGASVANSVGSQTTPLGTTQLSPNTWYNFAFTAKAGKVNLYLNGGSEASLTTWNGSYFTNSNITPKIGTSTTSFFSGSIDQVRVFDRALTPLEVEALYTEELCICDGTVDTLDILGDNSCIATYQLDGNANDLSGNYSGTPTDVSYGIGEFDLAASFNGSSSYIDLGAANQFTNNKLSFSFWCKLSGASALQNIFAEYTGGMLVDGELEIRRESDDKLIVGISNSSNFLYIRTDTPQLTNSYKHFVIVIDTTQATNNKVKIYVNGSLVPASNAASSGTVTGNVLTRSNHLYIGRRNLSAGQYFNGSIDQVRIFNKALSAGEVTTLYNETACTYTPKDYITTDLALDFFSKDITAASTTWTDRANSNVLTKSGSTVYNNATELVDFTGGYWGNDSLTETLKDASGDYTVEFFGSTNNTNTFIIAGIAQSASIRGLLFISGGTWQAYNYATNTNSNSQPNVYTSQTGLNHIILQYDNSGFQKFYLNGSLVSTTTTNLNNPFWTAPNGMRLGSDITQSQYFSDMDMGVFRVYKGLLSEQDILTNYNWAIRQF